jgi:RNA polymerase sigma factor (sigma-70 family)
MDEHALVAAARADPLRGFGVLYQRYADRIHDYCLAVLRHREDAADAAQDTFLIAYQRLGQLRDPGRLTPWLYAIARSRCLRRIAERRRQRPTEDLEPLGPVEPAATGKVESAELRQLVWDAAAGLADDDRAVLDLHLRQGLSGGELADALGVPAEKANLMLHRMKQRMGRTIGALLVARTARRDCPDLAAVTTGRLTPLVRKRLARHVERCRTCRARRDRLAPELLYASVPLAPAPLAVGERLTELTAAGEGNHRRLRPRARSSVPARRPRRLPAARPPRPLPQAWRRPALARHRRAPAQPRQVPKPGRPRRQLARFRWTPRHRRSRHRDWTAAKRSPPRSTSSTPSTRTPRLT